MNLIYAVGHTAVLTENGWLAYLRGLSYPVGLHIPGLIECLAFFCVNVLSGLA